MVRSARVLLLATTLAAAQLAGAGPAAAATARPHTSASSLPAGFGFGLANGPTDLSWMTGSGVPWRYRYQYLAGGVNTGNGWETWNTPPGQFATYYLTASQGAGYTPVFTYYELLQSSPSAGSNESDRDFNNLNNAATMNAYYGNFRLLMQKAAAFGGQVIVHVEPDLWGYLEQRANGGSAASLTAMVKSSGFADVAGIADTAQGFAGALLHLRDTYAPNVLLATHASSWASGVDIATNTNTAVNPAQEADKVAAFLNSAGVGANPCGSTFDLVFNDVADHDAAWWELVTHDGGAHWWDRTNAKLPNFNTWLAWMTELHAKTARQLVVWQVPVGNQYYLTMNNTDGHFQDNRAEIFIGHVPALQAAGVQAVMFGAGNAGQTTYTDAKADGITNNGGAPTTDLAGGCNACNTNTSIYADDDGGYLRVYVGQYYATLPPPTPIDHVTAVSTQQYRLTGSDGATWNDLDATRLSLTLAPTQNSFAIITGNADLWTATAGINQDLGIFLSPSSATANIVAWKESGGLAGTFSPNAATVETVVSLAAGTTYTVKLQWKTNRSAPGSTILAGAGPWPDCVSFSPTRLTAQLIPVSSATVQSVASSAQYRLGNSDGATWTDLDTTSSTPLAMTITPATDSIALLSGNIDLWTANAGFNQDIGVQVAEASSGQYPGQIVAWKESGGFAGTFSPNAAYVQGTFPMTHGQTYHVKLQWKTNKPAAGATIFAAAGLGPAFSPTRLTVQLLTPGPTFATVSTTRQFTLAGSDGTTWKDLANGGGSPLTLTITPTLNCLAVISGNADLWTANAGINQDLGIALTPSPSAGGIVAWKESGGFAGTFSPNAAFAQVVYPMTANTTYTVKLMWKSNKPAGAATIFAGAGPWPAGSGLFSPTRLTAQLIACA
jgi:hypothetical protein